MGFCAGSLLPGYLNPGYGFGYGFGRRGGGFGRGRGLGWYGPTAPFVGPAPAWYGYPYGYPAQPGAEAEREYLASSAEALRNQLSMIEKRLSELEAGTTGNKE
jgi:hypothetical protein